MITTTDFKSKMIAEMIDKLNRGEHIITYELVHVMMPNRTRIVGEIRYIVPLVSMPGESLASMMPLDPVKIIWDGTKWLSP